MIFKSQIAKAMTSTLAIVLFVSGCTKTREAAVPEAEAENIFALSDFGDLQAENPSMKMTTDSQSRSLGLGEASKATTEKGIVLIAKAEVPQRLQFMFKNLEITAQPDRTYPIAFSVDKKHVTAYKIVSNATELSILEKQLAQSRQEISIQKQIQKTSDKVKINSLIASMKAARNQKIQAMNDNKAQLLIPIFKYKVESFGVLEKEKNELKEETSRLRLKPSGWVEATHIKLSSNEEGRISVNIDASSKGELDRTFVMDRINNKIMTASTLESEYQVRVNTSPDSRILTLLDVDAMHIFELGSINKLELTESQLQQLKNNSGKSNVRYCTEEIKQQLPESERQDCVMILRFDVPVKYVKPELKALDEAGNQDAKVEFKSIRAGEQVGLVQIEKDVQPKKIENSRLLDPRSTIRVADIKNKEFFFKRTMQDAPVSTVFPVGMAGNLTLIKFELKEDRLVVRKADQLVQFKTGANDTDYEELMSIPVVYYKLEKQDSTGAAYSMDRMVRATNTDADYIGIDWSLNTLSTQFSPYTSMRESCISNVGSSQVSDVTMSLDKGTLNFTMDYSVSLSPRCISVYDSVNSYGGPASYQASARLKERVSFKLNDGSTEKSYAPQVPFKVQNQLGYGVWTIGKINPNENGQIGREGQEINYPVIHNFRNGGTIVYTVTGLEPSAPLAEDIRQLYRQTAIDVVNAWDFAYRQAFKGSALERAGRYVEIQFSGDPGITAVVGDLDKNIIHFENKFNDNHGFLGVSQVGFNPRSGVVVADSLIVYAANLQSFVANHQQRGKTIDKMATLKENFLKVNIAAYEKEKANAPKTEEGAATAQMPAGDKKPGQFTSQLIQSLKKIQPNANAKGLKNSGLNASNLKLAISEIQQVAAQMKSIGVSKFEYEIPQFKDAWINKALKKFSENPSMDDVELRGVIAKEMLASRAFASNERDIAALTSIAQKGAVRSLLRNQFKASPGCMLGESTVLGRNFGKRDFKEALRELLYFDLAHEMGHSQGLTHNFIGSFDKANFANEDGTPSKRVYSSVMDYFNPAKFQWDGIGSYDIHALRASHLGLLEVKPGFKAAVIKQGGDAAKSIFVNDKYISINSLKTLVTKNSGWNNFPANTVNGALKKYMYCTDIDVGYEPTCQRFDHGTSATEIVEDLIEDYDSHYVANYHAWDRNDFSISHQGSVVGGSMRIMFQMRQFMDEMYHKAVLEQAPDTVVADYQKAAMTAYFFYSNLISTPEATAAFQSPERYIFYPYPYQKLDEKGQPTGETVTGYTLAESRRTQSIASRPDRVDTFGIESDKIMAMNFLTMKGFPSYKYHSQNLLFSFLDFEKHIFGMKPENSFYVNTITDLLLDQVVPTVNVPNFGIQPLPGTHTVNVTPSMSAYAAIYSILNLEAMTLKETDNYANLFKVGSSLGRSPSDRLNVSPLGSAENSKTRISFWALDNAMGANRLIKEAVKKNGLNGFYGEIGPLMEEIFQTQVIEFLQINTKKGSLAELQKQLVAKLNVLNRNGAIVSSEALKANPELNLALQVETLISFNKEALNVAAQLATKKDGAQELAQQFAKQAEMLAKALPLFSIGQKALKAGAKNLEAKFDTSSKEGASLALLNQILPSFIDGSQNEIVYGLVLKNIEFLNKLTLVTNPEYNR